MTEATTAPAELDEHTGRAPLDAGFFGHPRGLATLFFTEMWERFSYYGMRALLILFMTASIADGGLGFDTAKAGPIYALYVSSVYLLSLPGGWIADRVVGLRRAVLIGGVVIMSGHICLAIPSLTTFYLGLVLIACGTGMLKGNIAAVVGQLYGPDDVRRDAGYSIYYMGINLGAFIAPLVTGWLAQGAGFRQLLAEMGMSPQTAWHWGFGAAAVGMFCGLVQYVAGGRHLPAAALHPVRPGDPALAAKAARQVRRIGIGTVAAVLVFAALTLGGVVPLRADAIADNFKYVIVALTVALFAWLFLSRGWSREERKRLLVIAALFAASAVFWMAYEQAGSTLNLFAQRNTDTRFLTHPFPPSWFQSLPPLFILGFAPVFAALWVKLGRRDPSSPAKFVAGLLLLGVGFAIMVEAASLAAGGARVSPMWLFFSYMLQTMGELCLSPVGLSAMSRLAPARIAGIVMGIWYLSIAVGNYLAGTAASVYETMSLTRLFALVTGTVFVAAMALALLVKPIKRMLERA
jgi:POT family proton-dependent oligopeptide transporter